MVERKKYRLARQFVTKFIIWTSISHFEKTFSIIPAMFLFNMGFRIRKMNVAPKFLTWNEIWMDMRVRTLMFKLYIYFWKRLRSENLHQILQKDTSVEVGCKLNISCTAKECESFIAVLGYGLIFILSFVMLLPPHLSMISKSKPLCHCT